MVQKFVLAANYTVSNRQAGLYRNEKQPRRFSAIIVVVFGPKMKEYTCFVFLGVGAYMTYFCMMASVNYWNQFYDLMFTTIASLVFNTADFLGVLVSPALQKRLSDSISIYTCFAAQFASITLLIPVHYLYLPALKYVTAQVIIAICGAFSGVFMSVINAVASGNGQIATHGVYFGVGVSEILVQSLKLLFAGIYEYIPGSAAQRQIIMQFSYFAGAQMYILFQFCCWFDLNKKLKSRAAESRELVAESEYIGVAAKPADKVPDATLPTRIFVKKIAISFAAIFTNYMTTYILFPALITAVPCHRTLKKNLQYRNEWWILINLSALLFSDCAGRFSANFKCAKRIMSIRVSLILAIAKTLFVPFFLCATLPPIIINDGKVEQRPYISIDWLSVLMCAALGFCGGITVASVFMRQGEVFDDKQSKKRASNWVTIGISTACMLAGVISIPIADEVQY